MERNLPDLFESQSEVELDGAAVLAAHVEPRDDSIAAVISNQLPNQACSQAFAAMRRMGADSADFGEAFEHQTLPAHRYQFSG